MVLRSWLDMEYDFPSVERKWRRSAANIVNLKTNQVSWGFLRSVCASPSGTEARIQWWDVTKKRFSSSAEPAQFPNQITGGQQAGVSHDILYTRIVPGLYRCGDGIVSLRRSPGKTFCCGLGSSGYFLHWLVNNTPSTLVDDIPVPSQVRILEGFVPTGVHKATVEILSPRLWIDLKNKTLNYMELTVGIFSKNNLVVNSPLIKEHLEQRYSHRNWVIKCQ